MQKFQKCFISVWTKRKTTMQFMAAINITGKKLRYLTLYNILKIS